MKCLKYKKKSKKKIKLFTSKKNLFLQITKTPITLKTITHKEIYPPLIILTKKTLQFFYLPRIHQEITFKQKKNWKIIKIKLTLLETTTLKKIPINSKKIHSFSINKISNLIKKNHLKAYLILKILSLIKTIHILKQNKIVIKSLLNNIIRNKFQKIKKIIHNLKFLLILVIILNHQLQNLKSELNWGNYLIEKYL